MLINCLCIFDMLIKFPLQFAKLSLLTAAKVEKYVALFESSPAKKASILMSLGYSPTTNLTETSSPLHKTEYLVLLTWRISEIIFNVKQLTGKLFSV